MRRPQFPVDSFCRSNYLRDDVTILHRKQHRLVKVLEAGHDVKVDIDSPSATNSFRFCERAAKNHRRRWSSRKIKAFCIATRVSANTSVCPAYPCKIFSACRLRPSSCVVDHSSDAARSEVFYLPSGIKNLLDLKFYIKFANAAPQANAEPAFRTMSTRHAWRSLVRWRIKLMLTSLANARTRTIRPRASLRCSHA